MDPQKKKELGIQRQRGWNALFSKYENLDDGDIDEAYSESEVTDNESYSESDQESDEQSDIKNKIDECDEALEDEPVDKILHDIDPNMFLQQFRTMCQRKIQTWEKHSEKNIVEYTKTKDERKKRRESIIDKSKGTITEENISTGGSMVPMKSNMKAHAIEPAAKNYGTPNRHIQNKSMEWEKSREHKTKDTTKRADAITEEIKVQSKQQFGYQIQKNVIKDIPELSDDDETQRLVTVSTNRALKSNGANGVVKELFEAVTTTTTTTIIKKIRRVSMLPPETTTVNALTIDSDFSSDDSAPCFAGKKGKLKKRFNIDSNDECPLTPKKNKTSSRHKAYSMESLEKSSAVVVATPGRSKLISEETMKNKYFAQFPDADIDTSNLREILLRRDETLKIIIPKTPKTSPVKRSKSLAIDQTSHKDLIKKKDILSTIANSPLVKKPIIAREK